MTSTADSIALIGIILGFAYIYIAKFDTMNPKTKRFMVVLAWLIVAYVVATYADDFIIDIQNIIDALNR